MNLTLNVWRRKDRATPGRMESYKAPHVEPHMSFLEMLDVVNEGLIKDGKEPIAFDHDCREGICGTCSLVINGMPHGPERGNTACQPNIVAGTVNADGSNPPQGVKLDPSGVICPISSSGKDADTPAVDDWNEIPPAFIADVDGVKSFPPAPTVGRSIADQLAEAGLSWRSNTRRPRWRRSWLRPLRSAGTMI